MRSSHVLIDLGEWSQNVQVEDQDGAREEDLAMDVATPSERMAMIAKREWQEILCIHRVIYICEEIE